MKRSPMKAGAKPLARTPFKRKSPMPSTGILSVQVHQRQVPARKGGMKTKQRPVTPAEKLLWSRLAALGCVACMKDGRFNDYVSIHHIDGRTKPGCHQLVLPLCAPHHQRDDTDPLQRIAIHASRARWEAKYGTERELLAECMHLLTTINDEATPVAASATSKHHL